MQRHGVKLEHVKIGRHGRGRQARARREGRRPQADGSVDLVWINGENFLAMKREGLLFGPFAEALPNYAQVDTAGKPTTRIDFSEPVEGMEAPWGMAQLTFYADSARRARRRRERWPSCSTGRKQNPGRFTYPKPPEFHGTTFLKQVLLEPAATASRSTAPYSAEAFAAPPRRCGPRSMRCTRSCGKQGKQFPASNTRDAADAGRRRTARSR